MSCEHKQTNMLPIVLIVLAALQFAETSETIKITAANFDQVIAKHNFIFVEWGVPCKLIQNAFSSLFVSELVFF